MLLCRRCRATIENIISMIFPSASLLQCRNTGKLPTNRAADVIPQLIDARFSELSGTFAFGRCSDVIGSRQSLLLSSVKYTCRYIIKKDPSNTVMSALRLCRKRVLVYLFTFVSPVCLITRYMRPPKHEIMNRYISTKSSLRLLLPTTSNQSPNPGSR